MATKTKKRKVNAADLETAQAEADLKYSGQLGTVKSLIGQAQAQYEDDITAAKNNAKAIQVTARAALPNVRKTFQTARTSADDAQADVARAFGGVGQAADVFRAATAREQGGQRGRISEAAARAEQDLTDRQTSAIAGRTGAINEARRSYRGNVQSLSDRLADIAGEQGASVVARLGELAEARAGRRNKLQTTRIGASSRERTAAANREAAAERSRKKASGTKRATNDQRLQLSNEVQKALGVARNNTSNPRSAVAKTMISGQTATKTTPAVPAFSQLATSIALDMAYDGHVSRANAKKLRDLGYKVTDLTGTTSYTDWKARGGQPKPAKPKPVGVFGRSPFG